MMSELNAKALEVFKSTFSIEGDVNTVELVYNEFPGWDSVGHMSLIAGLETVLDCMLEMEEILEISSFEKAVEIIGRHYRNSSLWNRQLIAGGHSSSLLRVLVRFFPRDCRV